MRKLIIALLMATIAISTIPLAYGFEIGYTGIGATTNTGEYCLVNNANLTVPVGYKAVLDKFYVYTDNSSAGVTVHGALYDDNLHLLGETTNIAVNGARWYSADLDLELMTGQYWIATGYGANGIRYQYNATGVVDSGYDAGYSFGDPFAFTAYNGNRVSMYITFEYEPVGGDPALWATVYTFGLIGVLGIILLMFKFKIPLLQIVIGILGLLVPVGLWSEPKILFTPFLQTVVFVCSFILLSYSLWSLRQE